MDSFPDNSNTFDIDEDIDLTQAEFNRAAEFLQHLVNKLDSNTLLEFYGLYKQSTVGKCNISKPGIFNMQGRAKWNAWNDLGAMSKELAMTNYIAKLTEIEPDWDQDQSTQKEKKSFWVSVSRPCEQSSDDEEPCEIMDKTLIDHVKEGNVDEILSFFSSNLEIDDGKNERYCVNVTSTIHKYDGNGLSAIHWAADRGHSHILEMLLMNGADVNQIDNDAGQTALHYAVSCGHYDCVKVLMKYDADRTVRDSDEATCLDIATEANDLSIIELLRN